MMRNILTPGRYPSDDPDFAEDGEGEEEKSEEEEKKEKKEEDEYDKQLREINTMEIMEEFDKLFKMSYISPSSSLKEQPKNKVITSKIADVTKSNNSFRKNYFREKTMKPFGKKENLDSTEKTTSKKDIEKLSKNEIKIDINDDNINTKSNKKDEFDLESSDMKRVDRRLKTYKEPLDMNILKNNLIGNKNENTENNEDSKPKSKIKLNKKKEKRYMFFSNIIKKEIEQPNIEDMNLFYFHKYHSVYLAKKATEKRVIDYFNKKQFELNKRKTFLPVIKDKNKITINEANKKSESVKKNEYNRLMESFGFNRRKYKNQFLY